MAMRRCIFPAIGFRRVFIHHGVLCFQKTHFFVRTASLFPFEVRLIDISAFFKMLIIFVHGFWSTIHESRF